VLREGNPAFSSTNTGNPRRKSSFDGISRERIICYSSLLRFVGALPRNKAISLLASSLRGSAEEMPSRVLCKEELPKKVSVEEIIGYKRLRFCHDYIASSFPSSAPRSPEEPNEIVDTYQK